MKSTDLPDKTVQLDAPTVDPSATAPTIVAGINGSLAGNTAAIDTLPTGAVLGRYVILAHLGEGGMGYVYAAYDPELDRKIALKLLRDLGDAAGLEHARARMLREAQAMARLSHPNVIAVHDVGIVDNRVFIAMEFVDGMTLRAWLAAEKRTLEEIIATFTQAGRGLAAAHAQGIVHRDFKPDNVLVGKDGRVRVLDFGLAHGHGGGATALPMFDRASITGQELPLVIPENLPIRPSSNALDTKLTQVGMVIGTPAYMSAEQFTGKPTDARTDQFSFCVALYEALYGELPYSGENSRELARAVFHGTMNAEPPGRRVPKKIRQALMRGLGPKKESRFASMDELLAAIQVDEKRNSWKWGALAAILVLSAITVGVLAKPREDPSAVCRTSKDKLAGIWDDGRKRAIQEAFTATEKPYAKDAFTGVERAIDDYSDQWVAMRTDACLATRVRGEQSEELFDLRMQCLANKLTELQAFTDILTKANAETVEKSVVASQSLTSLSACANVEALRSVVPPPKDEATRAKVQAIREQLARARALELAGRYKDQIPIAEKAAADVGQVKYRPVEAEVLLGLARARQKAGAPQEAEKLAMNAIYAAEAGRHDQVAFEAWLALAHWLSNLEGHEIERARSSAAHAGALLERIGGGETLRADLQLALGNIEYESGNYEKAREHYKSALTIRERVLGPDRTEVANALQDLAMAARYQGRHEEALDYTKRALAVLERNLGAHHYLVSRTLTTMGLTLEARGEYAEARKCHERALVIAEEAYGKEHNNTAVALMNLANVIGEDGRIDEAIALYTRALGIQEKVFGVGHVKTANILQNIGATLEEAGRHEDALPYFERALVIQEKAKGPAYVELCVPLSNLGTTLIGLKRFDEALERYTRALELAKKVHGDKHPYIADALVGIAVIHIERRQAIKALPLLEEALAMRMTLEEDPALIAQAKYELGRALWDTGKDKPRSLDLAKEAQKSFADAGVRAKRNAAEVDTWLRTHTLP